LRPRIDLPKVVVAGEGRSGTLVTLFILAKCEARLLYMPPRLRASSALGGFFSNPPIL
jgi:hypothetical protein